MDKSLFMDSHCYKRCMLSTRIMSFLLSSLQALNVVRSHHVFPPLSSPRIVLTRCPRVPALLQAKIASLDDAGFYDPFHAERARQGADKMNNISKFRF